MCVYAPGDQKRVSYFLGLELQVVVSHLEWMLGTELESSGRTACNFKKSFIFWDYNYIILCFPFLPEDPCTEPSLLSFKLTAFLFIVIASICCLVCTMFLVWMFSRICGIGKPIVCSSLGKAVSPILIPQLPVVLCVGFWFCGLFSIVPYLLLWCSDHAEAVVMLVRLYGCWWTIYSTWLHIKSWLQLLYVLV